MELILASASLGSSSFVSRPLEPLLPRFIALRAEERCASHGPRFGLFCPREPRTGHAGKHAMQHHEKQPGTMAQLLLQVPTATVEASSNWRSSARLLSRNSVHSNEAFTATRLNRTTRARLRRRTGLPPKASLLHVVLFQILQPLAPRRNLRNMCHARENEGAETPSFSSPTPS